MSKLIYLASPYSHVDSNVRSHRCHEVSRVGAELFKKGVFTYGPIAHSENLAKHGDMSDTKWETFRDFDLLMLSKCDELWILNLPGWDKSVGVRAEYLAAMRWGMPIAVIDSELNLDREHNKDLHSIFSPYNAEDDKYVREAVDGIRPLYSKLEVR